MTRRGPGRPKKASSERRSKWVLLRLTPPEYRRLEVWAKSRRLSLAEFVRRVVFRDTGKGGESRKEKQK